MDIYERVKMSEFQPGEDHVTQVMRVEQMLVGKKPVFIINVLFVGELIVKTSCVRFFSIVPIWWEKFCNRK